MKKFLVAFGILLILYSLWFYWRHPLTASLTIRGHVFYVDLAVTPAEKSLGLGNRDSLPIDRGMLFVWDHKEIFPFWMKGMRFALDMIWIDDNTVVDITPNVPAVSGSYFPIYHPRIPVNKVLEINAGLSQKLGIAIGDRVSLK